jgi:hypothetical protein
MNKIIQKTIDSNDNKIHISDQNEYSIEIIDIEKAFFKDKILDKKLTFYIYDDVIFKGYLFGNDVPLFSDITCINFEITIEDKIYFALNRLLGTKQSFIIDDDETTEELKNYLEIKRLDNKFIISIYDKDINKPVSDRFRIFIKNIGPDPRSKIDDCNIKFRICAFFKEAKEILLNENHQYSLDEYYEILKNQGYYNDSNPFIKNNRLYRYSYECCDNCINNCKNKEENNYWCYNYETNKTLTKKLK